MQEDLLLPDEKVISHRKSSTLVEPKFWLGAIFLILSLVSFVLFSYVLRGFLSISDLASKLGLSLSGYFWGGIPLIPTLLAVVGFIYVLYAELDVYFREYAVTTKRVMVKSGIVNKKFNVLLPSKIENVNIDIGLFERMFGLGKVVVTMQMDSKPPVVMGGIKEPYKFQTDILKLIGKQTGEPDVKDADKSGDGNDKAD